MTARPLLVENVVENDLLVHFIEVARQIFGEGVSVQILTEGPNVVEITAMPRHQVGNKPPPKAPAPDPKKQAQDQERQRREAEARRKK
jgi:hypothetical protein